MRNLTHRSDRRHDQNFNFKPKRLLFSSRAVVGIKWGAVRRSRDCQRTRKKRDTILRQILRQKGLRAVPSLPRPSTFVRFTSTQSSVPTPEEVEHLGVLLKGRITQKKTIRPPMARLSESVLSSPATDRSASPVDSSEVKKMKLAEKKRVEQALATLAELRKKKLDGNRYPSSWQGEHNALVSWEVVTQLWRNKLRKELPDVDNACFASHVKPGSLYQLLRKVYRKDSVFLTQARPLPSSPLSLYFDKRFLKFLFERFAGQGLDLDLLRSSFDNNWVVHPSNLHGLDSIKIDSAAVCQSAVARLHPPLRPGLPSTPLPPPPPPHESSKAATISSVDFTSTSTSSRGESNTEVHKLPSAIYEKRRREQENTTPHTIFSQHMIPTPPTSIESSPEPSAESDVAESTSEPRVKRAKMENPHLLAGMKSELELMQREMGRMRTGAGGTLFALDCELWERNKVELTEVGYSVLEFGRRTGGKITQTRETKHFVVKENSHRRNHQYVPDARDDFAYGRSLTLPEATIFALLESLFDVHSSARPLFLLFHDSRVDIGALVRLGFERQQFKSLSEFNGEGIYVVDTQRLFSAVAANKSQISLEKSLARVGLSMAKAHNAGNDAKATLDIAEKLLDRNCKLVE